MFRDELEQILTDFLDLYEVGNNTVLECKHEALTSIINLVDKELPPLKNGLSKSARLDNQMLAGDYQNKGYNKAILDMRAIIRNNK